MSSCQLVRRHQEVNTLRCYGKHSIFQSIFSPPENVLHARPSTGIAHLREGCCGSIPQRLLIALQEDSHIVGMLLGNLPKLAESLDRRLLYM